MMTFLGRTTPEWRAIRKWADENHIDYRIRTSVPVFPPKPRNEADDWAAAFTSGLSAHEAINLLMADEMREAAA